MTITLTARQDQRARYRAEALHQAALKGRTLRCEHPDVQLHGTCLGLEALGPLGCLCECHDQDAS
jgi:hypothetical protein